MKNHVNWGGKRPGAGRPKGTRRVANKKEVYSWRLTKEEHILVREYIKNIRAPKES